MPAIAVLELDRGHDGLAAAVELAILQALLQGLCGCSVSQCASCWPADLLAGVLGVVDLLAELVHGGLVCLDHGVELVEDDVV